jgi:hypothetical protein
LLLRNKRFITAHTSTFKSTLMGFRNTMKNVNYVTLNRRLDSTNTARRTDALEAQWREVTTRMARRTSSTPPLWMM